MHDAWTAAIARGDYQAAWEVNDAVLAARTGPPDDPSLPYHLRYVWSGRPPDGRHVLVRCYHGLGDTLQFARYLAPLRQRAASVTLEAQSELLPLLEGMADRVIPFDVAHPLPPSECDIEIMELMHALRLPPEALPPPYLPSPAALRAGTSPIGRGDVTFARERPLPSGEVGAERRVRAVAICHRAGDWNPARSIPLPLLLDAIGDCSTTLLEPTPRLFDTVERITASDLVITVDTMAAHLAGAMNRPTLLLLKAEPDWRWLEPGAHSRWYPNTRLFRQRTPGDWSGPLEELKATLTHATGAARPLPRGEVVIPTSPVGRGRLAERGG